MSRPSAQQLIYTTLRQNGPQTTQSIFTLIHASGESLPVRPPPRNFLAGVTRTANRELRPTPKGKPFPGEAESSHGKWSITYLKKNVLKEMEARGTLLKLTRRKWEKVSNPDWTIESAAIAAAVAAGEAGAAVEDATSKKGRAAIATAEKEADVHVWALKEEYNLLFKKQSDLHAASLLEKKALLAKLF